MTQARIAETEKYAHVNILLQRWSRRTKQGRRQNPCKISKVATYDLKPEMSAYEVCDKLVDAIKSDKI